MAAAAPDRDVVSRAFREADVGNTGKLELSELQFVLGSIRPSVDWTDADVEKILLRAGFDIQGAIDLEDFLAWVYTDGNQSQLGFECSSLESTVSAIRGSASNTGRGNASSPGSRVPSSPKRLYPSSVFVRIRPTTEDARSGHTAGEAVTKEGLAKTVKSWDDATITVQDDDQREDLVFGVTGVIPPEFQQPEAFDAMLPDLLDAFHTDSNVLFFAYGQTGSGKTHTLLGEVESLASPNPVPGWGIFPRIVHATLQKMRRQRAEGVQAILLATAVEFYCGVCFDLNSDPNCKTEVTIDRDANLFGTRSKEIRSTKQLRKWIMRMYANRTTAKTRMNDASSRSHCAFVLTLHQLLADDSYIRTNFSLIDMAGSERHIKTGGVRLTPKEVMAQMGAMMEAGTPEKLSTSAQGYMINCELSFIATEILKASEAHKKGMPYHAQKEMSTPLSFYFQACCDGRARLGACVTISQSPQHGYESWFSVRFAEQLASYRGPVRHVQHKPMTKALEDATMAAEDAAAKFANWGDDPKPSGPKQWRVLCLQSGAATHTAETLEILHKLVEQRDSKAPCEDPEEDGEESDSDWPPPPATRPKKAVTRAIKRSALEMGKTNENFSVFIRVRPMLVREGKAGAKNCLTISDIDFPRDPPPQRITVKEAGASMKGSFVFDRVFDESYSQQDMYEATAQRYVADFLNCINVTIFAYGQTGTGKTHTIAGPSEDPGIMSRCLGDIFVNLPTTGLELYYEYVQLYLGDLKDLLVERQRSELRIVERKDGSVYVQNLSSFKATSADEVLQALAEGAKRRATRAQDMNAVSSRSHAILMLRLVNPGEEPSAAIASMFVVDLAGSERISRSHVTGQGFDEATAINQSLTSLGRVVITLVENESSGGKFVPYNGDPLTMVLKAGLGGNSRTALIACVTQAADSLSESVNTLRFAMQASHVKNKVERKEAREKEEMEREKIAEAGTGLMLDSSGRGRVGLACGELDVLGDLSAGDGAPLVVIIGGYGADPAVWVPMGAEMRSAGFRWLVPTFPGHGENTGTRCCSNANDVISKNSGPDVVVQLLDRVGAAKAHVVGIDWGAGVTVGLLAKSGRRVGRYAIVADVLKRENPMNASSTVGADLMFLFSFFYEGVLKDTIQKLKKKALRFYYPSKTAGGRSLAGPIKSMGNKLGAALGCQVTDNYFLDVPELGRQIASALRK